MLPDRHLTQAQQRVVALMSASFTATAAARSVAVHRKTAGHWFRSSALREALMQAVVTRTSPVESKPGRSLPLPKRSAPPRPSRLIRNPPCRAPASRTRHAGLPARPIPRRRDWPQPPCPCDQRWKFKRCCTSIC